MTERKCVICGKTFYANILWAYKVKHYGKETEYYCSWTCYRKQGKRRKYENLTR